MARFCRETSYTGEQRGGGVLEREEWGKRGVVVEERAPDEVCERQGMAGEEELVTTQECVCTVHGHAT